MQSKLEPTTNQENEPQVIFVFISVQLGSKKTKPMLTCGCVMQSTRCFTLSNSQSYYFLLMLSFLFVRRICEFIRTQTILQNNCCKSNALRSSFKKGLITVSIVKAMSSGNSISLSCVFCSTYLPEHCSYVGHSLSS